MEKIEYKLNKSVQIDVFNHLQICDNSFSPPLSSKVNIEEYSSKLCQKSFKIEAWESEKLIGLIAFYQNDIEDFFYITNVSIDPNYLGRGIANRLMENTIDFAKKQKINKIILEVDKNNEKAINLYKKHNFVLEKQQKNSLFLKRTI